VFGGTADTPPAGIVKFAGLEIVVLVLALSPPPHPARTKQTIMAKVRGIIWVSVYYSSKGYQKPKFCLSQKLYRTSEFISISGIMTASTMIKTMPPISRIKRGSSTAVKRVVR